jgi:hypothetical protein
MGFSSRVRGPILHFLVWFVIASAELSRSEPAFSFSVSGPQLPLRAPGRACPQSVLRVTPRARRRCITGMCAEKDTDTAVRGVDDEDWKRWKSRFTGKLVVKAGPAAQPDFGLPDEGPDKVLEIGPVREPARPHAPVPPKAAPRTRDACPGLSRRAEALRA